MSFYNIKKILIEVIEKLYKDDKVLFDYDIASEHLICERTLSFRIGYYLQNKFTDYNVDCEYNRLYKNRIKLKNNKLIYPDIIIHKRTIDTDNLLWIEVKKKTANKEEIDEDRKRLKDVTSDNEYNYDLGCLIILGNKKYELEWYINGKKLKEN